MLIIKIGGGKTINLDYIIEDLKGLREPFVIVHGGNYILDSLLEKLGIVKKYYTSPNGQISRATDQKIIDAMYMAYAGFMNKTIVAKCQQQDINAVGLSGIDGKLITGKRHEAFISVENGKKNVIRDDLTGTVESVHTDILQLLLAKGFIPVITPPVLSTDNQVINADGDKLAAKIAVSLKAEKLLFLIEAPGFLKDANKPESVFREIKKEEIEKYMESAKGRMKKKLIMSKWALEHGVGQVLIGDGRSEEPVSGILEGKNGTAII